MRFGRAGTVGLGLLCAHAIAHFARLCGAEPTPNEPPKPWLPEIRVETYTLANGLTVILHEDNKTPLVAVNVTYNVGSKDDPPGKTGFAHLFEHLMFEGSEHHDASFHWPIYRFMADGRGTTHRDTTVYRETVTNNTLERVLWLEADRMGFLLPAITADKLHKARNVVKNERWQNYDDPALSEVEEAFTTALYPPGHPYRHMIIGSFAGLAAAQLGDVYEFFHRHYSPNNAFLCIAGDFDPMQARRWIKTYFGPLRQRPIAAPAQPDAAIFTGPRRITLNDRVSHARAKLIWPTVPINDPDEAALDVLASLLGGGYRWNRLYRALVYDRQIASQVGATHSPYRLAGWFEVDLVARSGQKLDELVRFADLEIQRLRSEGPTADEIRKVKIEQRSAQILELESVTSKARLLNHSAATRGDALGYRSLLAKVFAVTSEDIRRVARAYLGTGRIEVVVYPGARATNSRESERVAYERNEDVDIQPVPLMEMLDRSVMPEVGPAPYFISPRVNRRKLSNGLELLIAERHELPRVQLTLVVRSGETSLPRGKSGLASMTVSLLEEGTKARTALQLEGELLEIGASLWTEGLLESCTVNLTAATRNLERALDLYADVVLHPSFDDGEFLRLKLARLEDLRTRADNAKQIAEDVLPRLIYHRDHPYARAARGTPESVRSITREDLVAFYRWAFVPGNAALVVVGDVRADKIAAALERRLGAWSPGPIPRSPDLHPVPAPFLAQTIYLVDKPGLAQSVLAVGRIGTSIRSPDRHALVILSDKLGSRIASNLLDEKASTYGFSENFDFRNGAGPLVVTGSVHAFDTKDALLAVFKEMKDLAGQRPVTDEDVAEIQESKLPRSIDNFETNADVTARVSSLASHHLPIHHFEWEQAKYRAVTKTDVDRLAKSYLSPRRMTVLVVGDRTWIEESLSSLPFVKTIRLLDAEGNPIATRPAETPTAASAVSGESATH